MGMIRKATDQAMANEYAKLPRAQRRAMAKPQMLKQLKDAERQLEAAGNKKELKEVRRAIRLCEAIRDGEL